VSVMKLAAGLAAWPAWWVGSGRTETRCLVRLLVAVCGPVSAGSALSSLTGGWALPVTFALVFMSVVPGFCAPHPGSRSPLRRGTSTGTR